MGLYPFLVSGQIQSSLGIAGHIGSPAASQPCTVAPQSSPAQCGVEASGCGSTGETVLTKSGGSVSVPD